MDDVIEIKLGEDVYAMEAAWHIHNAEREKFIREGHTLEEANAAGLRQYSWIEWKKYYRKMHGLPEDGIKRVPFNGKRKKRDIRWYSSRFNILDPAELKKYGLEYGISSISLDTAYRAAGDLFKEAKTVHSVRDGLRVLSAGIRTERRNLARKRKEGYPVVEI